MSDNIESAAPGAAIDPVGAVEGAPAVRTVRAFGAVGPALATRADDERGITTAEYAVGTAAGAGLAGLLYKMLSGGFGEGLLKTLFDHVLGLLGIK